MIADPFSPTAQFSDQQIQDRLDANRDDIRYEPLALAPSIVNINNTAASAETIYADYYSAYGYWESDVVLQGQGATGLPWIVLTPVASELLLDQAHWQFEASVFTAPSVPGQVPPVFATGKVYDVFAAAADLLQFWAASLAGAYDITVNGQTLRRSQLIQAKMTLAKYYLSQARPRIAKMTRDDIAADSSARRYRLLDSDDIVRGA